MFLIPCTRKEGVNVYRQAAGQGKRETVELIPTLGALPPRGRPVQDPVLPGSGLQVHGAHLRTWDVGRGGQDPSFQRVPKRLVPPQ